MTERERQRQQMKADIMAKKKKAQNDGVKFEMVVPDFMQSDSSTSVETVNTSVDQSTTSNKDQDAIPFNPKTPKKVIEEHGVLITKKDINRIEKRQS